MTCRHEGHRQATFPGQPSEIGNARSFVEHALHGCPVADMAVLITSEITTNAVRYSRSAGTGHVTVEVDVTAGTVLLEVTDEGSDDGRQPEARASTDDDEHGRGLHIVAALASDWGRYVSEAGTTVWARIDPQAPS